MKSRTSVDYFKYCPKCGARLRKKTIENLWCLICSGCGFVFYQNAKPTVSALIVNGKSQILLVRRGINPKYGYWDFPGGFLEEREKPVAGLRREMKEELGIGIKTGRLIGAYLDTYFEKYLRYTLNLIYVVKIASGKMKPMDDVAGWRWFDKNKIPWARLAFKWMRPAFRDGLQLL